MQIKDTKCPECGVTGALVRVESVEAMTPIAVLVTEVNGQPTTHEMVEVGEPRYSGDAEDRRYMCTDCLEEWGPAPSDLIRAMKNAKED